MHHKLCVVDIMIPQDPGGNAAVNGQAAPEGAAVQPPANGAENGPAAADQHGAGHQGDEAGLENDDDEEEEEEDDDDDEEEEEGREEDPADGNNGGQGQWALFQGT